MDDLEEKVFGRFDDQTVVHPGHGDATTLGRERAHLTEWRGEGLVDQGNRTSCHDSPVTPSSSPAAWACWIVETRSWVPSRA